LSEANGAKVAILLEDGVSNFGHVRVRLLSLSARNPDSAEVVDRLSLLVEIRKQCSQLCQIEHQSRSHLGKISERLVPKCVLLASKVRIQSHTSTPSQSRLSHRSSLPHQPQTPSLITMR
jgi:hypothetical protein